MVRPTAAPPKFFRNLRTITETLSAGTCLVLRPDMWANSQVSQLRSTTMFSVTTRLISATVFVHMGLVLAVSAKAQDVPIPVLNPKFETDVLTCSPGSNCNQYGITGWTTGPGTGVFKASTTQYPGIAP